MPQSPPTVHPDHSAVIRADIPPRYVSHVGVGGVSVSAGEPVVLLRPQWYRREALAAPVETTSTLGPQGRKYRVPCRAFRGRDSSDEWMDGPLPWRDQQLTDDDDHLRRYYKPDFDWKDKKKDTLNKVAGKQCVFPVSRWA